MAEIKFTQWQMVKKIKKPPNPFLNTRFSPSQNEKKDATKSRIYSAILPAPPLLFSLNRRPEKSELRRNQCALKLIDAHVVDFVSHRHCIVINRPLAFFRIAYRQIQQKEF